jgi:predicted metal-binding membrane protein
VNAPVRPSFPRDRAVILGVLLLLAAACWAVLLWQARQMQDTGMGLTMGMTAPLFLAIWVVMMVAMMFPAASPMGEGLLSLVGVLLCDEQ